MNRRQKRFIANIQAALTDPQARAEIQAFLIEPTILTGPQISTRVRDDNRGNQFRTYARQVQELWKRWRQEAQYGNTIVREAAKYTTGWIAGNGANITVNGSRENKFLEKFLRINRLESSFLTRIVRGGQFEGKALIFLDPVQTDEGVNVKLKFLRWEKFGYDINVNKQDESIIESATFVDTDGVSHTIKPDQFVYVLLDQDGRDINRPSPPLGDILTDAINLGKALADYRDYNHLWGVLGIHYNTKDVQSAEMLTRFLDSRGEHKLGDTLAFPGNAYFPEPSGAGTNSIEKEITLLAKIISGVSGIPIHLLGFASEMSNRATAEEMQEAIHSLTAEPRDIWEDAIKDIVKKAFDIANRSGETLTKESINVKLTQVTRHQIKELTEVWMPLAQNGYISDDEVRRRIPGIDAERMKKELEEDKSENREQQKEMLDLMRQEEQEEPFMRAI